MRGALSKATPKVSIDVLASNARNSPQFDKGHGLDQARDGQNHNGGQHSTWHMKKYRGRKTGRTAQEQVAITDHAVLRQLPWQWPI
jgi:hypothetical protein